jgi:hypothetical protein
MDDKSRGQPKRPTQIPDYAEACLQALVKAGLGDQISLGGAFGLLHYLDYRLTNDVDAWWASTAATENRQRVVDTITSALQPLGAVRKRVWGDVVSIELVRDQKKVFSFQIADRSAQLQPSVTAQWIDVQLDSFTDLLASKMTALIDRGAPRDFRDVYIVCQAGFATLRECWRLWQERQGLAGNEADPAQARLALETHLERIEQHRPLSQIADPLQRAEAERVRAWFRNEFSNASMA